jgi:hypothetical protein
VSIATVTQSGDFSVGNPLNSDHAIRSPLTIGTLGGTFDGTMVKANSPVSIGLLTGSLDIGNAWVGYPDQDGVHSPVNVGSMSAAAYLHVSDLSSELTVGDPNDPNNVYRGNTPSRCVWRIDYFRGDMNNDYSVDFGDVTPFTTALTSPPTYALQFPGLADQRVVHGDVNCDGVFDFADINPFIDILFQPPTCCGMDGGQMNGFQWDGAPEGDGSTEYPAGYDLSPEELAAQLAAETRRRCTMPC